jgi:hypothetical protein
MIPGVVGTQIGRANRNLLLVNIGLLIVIGLIGYACSGLLYNFFKGPQEINISQVPKMGDPDSIARYWVRARIDKGRFEKRYYEIGGNKRSTSYYFVLDLPEGGLVIESGTSQPGDFIEGTLSHLTSEARDKAIPGLNRISLQPAILPVMISNTGVRYGSWVFMVTCIPLALLAVWNISKAISRMGDPAKHPVCNVLRRFGPPEEIAVGIDAEYKAGAQATGNVQLTQSWLMRKRGFGLDLLYLGDVVWAYKKETKHRTNGVPTGTTYSSMIYDKNGKLLDLGLKKDQTEQLLQNIRKAVPWVVLGYDKQLANMWSKNRAAMLQSVEARKEAYLAAAAKAEGAAAPVQTDH